MKATTIILGKKLLREMVDYVERDQRAQYRLKESVFVVFSGRNIGIGNFQNPVLKIDSAPQGDTVKLRARPFAASTGYWNGPDLIPDDWDDGSMEMSLWHDLVWYFRKDIAAACGMTEQQVMRWANGLLHAAWIGYGQRKEKPPIALETRARIGYRVTEVARHVFHPIKRLCKLLGRLVPMVLVALGVAGCSGGCSAIPDWEMTEGSEVVWEEGAGTETCYQDDGGQ